MRGGKPYRYLDPHHLATGEVFFPAQVHDRQAQVTCAWSFKVQLLPSLYRRVKDLHWNFVVFAAAAAAAARDDDPHHPKNIGQSTTYMGS